MFPGEGLDWQHIRNEFYGAVPESFGQVPGSRWAFPKSTNSIQNYCNFRGGLYYDLDLFGGKGLYQCLSGPEWTLINWESRKVISWSIWNWWGPQLSTRAGRSPWMTASMPSLPQDEATHQNLWKFQGQNWVWFMIWVLNTKNWRNIIQTHFSWF